MKQIDEIVLKPHLSSPILSKLIVYSSVRDNYLIISEACYSNLFISSNEIHIKSSLPIN